MDTQTNDTPRLFRLLYASEARHPFTVQEIAEMLVVARERNRSQAISGVLCHGNGHFLQCLEGPRDAVNALYSRIASDSRHSRVNLLGCYDISAREFPNWDMAYIRNLSPYLKLIQELGKSDTFNPHVLNATDALYLLRFMTLGLNGKGEDCVVAPHSASRRLES